MDILVKLVRLVILVLPHKQLHPGHLVLPDQLVMQDQMDQMENLVSLERRVKMVNEELANLDLKVLLDRLVVLEKLVVLEILVEMVLPDLKARLDLPANQVNLVAMDNPVPMVKLVFLAPMLLIVHAHLEQRLFLQVEVDLEVVVFIEIMKLLYQV